MEPTQNSYNLENIDSLISQFADFSELLHKIALEDPEIRKIFLEGKYKDILTLRFIFSEINRDMQEIKRRKLLHATNEELYISADKNPYYKIHDWTD